MLQVLFPDFSFADPWFPKLRVANLKGWLALRNCPAVREVVLVFNWTSLGSWL